MDWNIFIRNPEVTGAHIKALKRSNTFLGLALLCVTASVYLLNKKTANLEKRIKNLEDPIKEE